MTDRCIRDPDLGLAARLGAWLFPSLHDGPGHQVCLGDAGPCDRIEPEPEAEL